MRVIALVPIRGNSERVPGKNRRTCAGRPLFHWVLETLLTCPEVQGVAVDTDCGDIESEIRACFPSVTTIRRPEGLLGGDTPVNEILVHDVQQVSAEWYLQTHCTNPLLRPETVTRAVRALEGAWPRHDSLFSVTRLQGRLWDSLARPINHNPSFLARTQDLPPLFEENSNLYIFRGDSLLSRRTRLGERPIMFEMPRDEAWDIDEELDFRIAEMLLQMRSIGGG